MSQLNDLQYQTLGIAGFTGNLNERELAWLQANGATSDNLNQAWYELLTTALSRDGQITEMRYEWLETLGYDQEHINDRWFAYLSDQAISATGAIAWLKPDNIVHGGGLVTSWPNDSVATGGAAYDMTLQLDSANVKLGTANGNNVVQFDTIAAALQSAAAQTIAQPITMFMQLKPDDSTTGSGQALMASRSGGSAFLNITGTGNVQLGAGSGTLTSSAVGDVSQAVSYVLDSPNSELAGSQFTTVTGDVGVNSYQYMTLGANNAGSSGFVGWVGEVIFWNKVLTQEEKNTVRGVLQGRWGF